MSGPDKPLGWSRTQALGTVTIEDTEADVGASDTVILSIDHSATVEFADNPLPSVDVTAGFVARVLACDDAGNAADGGRVCVELENTTAGTLTAEYAITRRGVLA
jgi:hypothetical protein